MNASHGKWKIDIAEAFCSSPPAPTPKMENNDPEKDYYIKLN